MSAIRSWTVSDELWAEVEPVIPKPKREGRRRYRRKPGGGRPPLDPRLVFEGIVYVLRTGCQWKALPEERFGSASSIHKYFRLWSQKGVFVRLWRKGLAAYDDMEGIAWQWQSLDGGMVKAPLAQEAVGPNTTDRGKKGSKRSLLVDARGTPLSIVASGANVHDVKLLEPTLDQIVVERPPVQEPLRENLCLDAGYAGEPARKAVEARHYVPHVRPRGEEVATKKRNPRARARRWVVERTHSWLNRYRKLLVRFEKTAVSFEGLLQLACALIVFRRIIVVYG